MKPKNLLTVLAISACFNLPAVADVITPTGATSTSTVGDGRVIGLTIDGTGLVDVSDPADVLDDYHPYQAFSYWLSAANAVSSGTEELTFELGGTYDVDTVYYWLYTRDGDRNLKTFDISYSTDGGSSFSTPVAAASLNMANWSIGPSDRSNAYVESRTFDTLSGITHVRFSNLENHGDGSYFAMMEIRFGGQATSVVAGPVDAGNSTVTASPTTVLADGTSTSTITVTLRDSGGTPVTGEDVTLAAAPGTPTINPSATQTTDGSGVATFTVSSGTVGTEVFSATSSTDSVTVTQTASIDFLATTVEPSTSTVVASPTSVEADDTDTSTITVTVRNSGGLPLPGKLVALSGNGSATIAPAGAGTDTTNANGEATFTVKSGVVGTEIFTATSETVAITDTASVDFTAPVVVGPVDAGNSTVVASPTSVAADGSEASLITVTLKDAAGLAVANEGVTLSITSGPGAATILPVDIQSTDANGQATFTASSSTPGTEVFTATAVDGPVIITQTASVEFIEVGASQLINLLDAPVAASTSATGGTLTNLFDTTMSLTFVGTGTNGGASFRWTPKDSGSYAGDSVKSQTIIYDMGEIVTFDGFIHAQAHESDFSSVGSIDFWVSNSDPGSDWTAIANTYFGTTPDASKALNRGDRNLYEYVLDGAKLTGRYVIMRWICYEQATDTGSPGGYTFYLGQTASVGDYDTWAGSHPGLGGPAGDDDFDGLSNEYERLFGLNPLSAGSSNPYAAAFDPAAGTFSYTRRTQALTGMTYKVWYSTNLTEWFWESGASESVGAPVAEIETVEVTIDPSLLTEPRLFLQMSVEDLGPAPVISSLWGANTTVTVNFSEAMGSSAADPVNYTIEQSGGGTVSVTGASLSGDGRTATLTLASALDIGSSFTVTANRIANGVGQPLGNGTTAQFQTWDDDPAGIKVFILAGQSNMVGYGHTETGQTGDGGLGTLRYLANNNATYPEYDYTSLLETPGDPVNSPWRTRGDVKVWWYNGASGNLPTASSTPTKGDLGPPFHGADSSLIGPEYAFGQIIGDYYASDDVLIIKAAWGGHKLAEDFRPPSAVAARGGEVGLSYLEIFNNAREVLDNLGTEFPEWAGRGYQIVGFAWHQGTSDKSPIERALEYKYNLPDFISDVRAEFGKPNLPFVIATAGMTDAGVEPSPYPGYSDVERAQLWVFPESPKPAHVLSSDTRGFWEDAAVSPRTQGFHWNGNARSYFRVGKALGDDMVTLLSGS